MSGAAYNGDMATVTFGFPRSRMRRIATLGLEVIKFLLNNTKTNRPSYKNGSTSGYGVATGIGAGAVMMDYMPPNKVMSWKGLGMYFEEAGGALFKDLARWNGIVMPDYL